MADQLTCGILVDGELEFDEKDAQKDEYGPADFQTQDQLIATQLATADERPHKGERQSDIQAVVSGAATCGEGVDETA